MSALRHRRYLHAIDAGRFRAEYGSGFATAIAGILAVVGVVMALYLAAS